MAEADMYTINCSIWVNKVSLLRAIQSALVVPREKARGQSDVVLVLKWQDIKEKTSDVKLKHI